MSKCDLRIEFANPERTFRCGGVVSGVVHLKAYESLRCEGLRLRARWATHGRGNVDGGSVHEELLFRGDLEARDVGSFPFEFVAPAFPPTIRGRDIHVDHLLDVRMDVPWAFDPKVEQDYVLLSTSDEGAVHASMTLADPGTVEDSLKASSKTASAVLFTLAGLGLLLPMPFKLLVLLVAGGFGVRSGLRARALRKLGRVEASIEPTTLPVGASVRLAARLVPPKPLELEHIRAGLRLTEVCTSGSGTNETTNEQVLYEGPVVLSGKAYVGPGEPLEIEAKLAVPVEAPPSFASEHNQLGWQAWLEVKGAGLPRWRRAWTLAVEPFDWSAIDEGAADADAAAADAAADHAAADHAAAAHAVAAEPPPLPREEVDLRLAAALEHRFGMLLGAGAAGAALVADGEEPDVGAIGTERFEVPPRAGTPDERVSPEAASAGGERAEEQPAGTSAGDAPAHEAPLESAAALPADVSGWPERADGRRPSEPLRAPAHEALQKPAHEELHASLRSPSRESSRRAADEAPAAAEPRQAERSDDDRPDEPAERSKAPAPAAQRPPLGGAAAPAREDEPLDAPVPDRAPEPFAIPPAELAPDLAPAASELPGTELPAAASPAPTDPTPVRVAAGAHAGTGLAALVAAVEALDRFGPERARRIAAALGDTHTLELIVERVNWTYGAVGDAHRGGRTLTGTLASDGVEGPTVALRLPADANERADALEAGDRVRAVAELETWNPTYGTPELEADGFERVEPS